jgi:hypothetical protein
MVVFTSLPEARRDSNPSYLKGQCTRFSILGFFHQSTPYMSLINRLNPSCILHSIRRENCFESRQNRKWGLGNPQLFSASSTCMGIFAIAIFLPDFSFKGRKRTCKVCLRFQRCQWHRGNRFSGVNDTAETISA